MESRVFINYIQYSSAPGTAAFTHLLSTIKVLSSVLCIAQGAVIEINPPVWYMMGLVDRARLIFDSRVYDFKRVDVDID